MVRMISADDVREHLPDYLRRVKGGVEQFVIEQAGKPVAALVPMSLLKQFREGAPRKVLEYLDPDRPTKGRPLTDERAMDLANEAKRRARWQAHRRK